MFKIGDKVSHPNFGVGAIEKIEEKNILGKKQQYYILKLSINEMILMIPVNRAKEIGLRHIIDRKTVPEVLNVLGDKVDKEMRENYKQRIKTQSEMVDSGDLLKVAQVVKNYTYLKRKDKLSTTEKGLLERAQKILESEISAACNIEKNKVKFLIKEAVDREVVSETKRKNH